MSFFGNGREQNRLDKELVDRIDESSRNHLWEVACDIINSADAITPPAPRTGLVLGYVQSGKTTAMTTLMASAVDHGYQLIIAILGSTNILLSQNTLRIKEFLGIDVRSDYAWVEMQNPSGVTASKEIASWVRKGRALFIPILKNKGRIASLANVLGAIPNIGELRVLIVDDEADQGSLNTGLRSGTESPVYAAIDQLRESLPNHAFIQYTATPYAPLLLDQEDPLFPRFVKFLQPGKRYTGGREFFIDNAESVIRYIPMGDEQLATRLPIELPESLQVAFWSFIVGAAFISKLINKSAPISMLIHASHRNDVQERYNFLLIREIRARQNLLDTVKIIADLPTMVRNEVDRLLQLGVAILPDDILLSRMKYVLKEIKLWLLNSVTAIKKVDWNISPFHVLVGGNKLDRGFTVEGLTISYMNRQPSDQVDTLEQRARAFGYRSDFLPFCQFFGSARTVKLLREIVFTEYDLRAKMQDYIEEGRSIAEWVNDIGLLIPGGMRPTRDAVVRQLSNWLFGWHQISRPSLDASIISANWKLCEDIGIFKAPVSIFGRLNFRTLHLPSKIVSESLLKPWALESYSPGWRREDLLKAFDRAAVKQSEVQVVFMEQDAGTPNAKPRIRRWTEQEGFINLFQGRDVTHTPGNPFYLGDRLIAGLDTDTDKVLIQIHRVVRRDQPVNERLLTLALHLGDRKIVKRISI